MLRFALSRTLVTLILISPALAASPAEQRGKTFALANCARCHSIDRATQSPLKIAPPFRTLHLRYPVETLGEALAEGIETRWYLSRNLAQLSGHGVRIRGREIVIDRKELLESFARRQRFIDDPTS